MRFVPKSECYTQITFRFISCMLCQIDWIQWNTTNSSEHSNQSTRAISNTAETRPIVRMWFWFVHILSFCLTINAPANNQIIWIKWMYGNPLCVILIQDLCQKICFAGAVFYVVVIFAFICTVWKSIKAISVSEYKSSIWLLCDRLFVHVFFANFILQHSRPFTLKPQCCGREIS